MLVRYNKNISINQIEEKYNKSKKIFKIVFRKSGTRLIFNKSKIINFDMLIPMIFDASEDKSIKSIEVVK